MKKKQNNTIFVTFTGLVILLGVIGFWQEWVNQDVFFLLLPVSIAFMIGLLTHGADTIHFKS